jgi:hypothetical protein
MNVLSIDGRIEIDPIVSIASAHRHEAGQEHTELPHTARIARF